KTPFRVHPVTIETGRCSCQTGKTEAKIKPDCKLPTVHGAVELAIDGQVRAAIRIVGCELLVDVHAEAGGIAGMHHSVGKGVGMREDAIGFGGVVHIFLNAEIMDAEIEMKRSGHAYGAHIGVPMTDEEILVQLVEACNYSQMGNSSS